MLLLEFHRAGYLAVKRSGEEAHSRGDVSEHLGVDCINLFGEYIKQTLDF